MLTPHTHTVNGKVLILKCTPKNRIGYNNFKYPSGVGSIIPCPDWNPEPVCGGGIHGWPWGFGLGEGKDYDIIGDVWMVLSAPPTNVVGNLEGGLKCKAKDPEIVFEGTFNEAFAMVSIEWKNIISKDAAKYDEKTGKFEWHKDRIFK